MRYVILYIITGVIFAAIDTVWLKLTANFYKKEFGSLLRSMPNFGAAIVFYLLYILGILLFVILPFAEIGEWWQVALRGAIFGMVTYGTYELTNLATLKKWSYKVTVIDILWGMVVTGSSAALAFLFTKGWLY